MITLQWHHIPTPVMHLVHLKYIKSILAHSYAVDGHMGASLLHQTHGDVSSRLNLGNNCIQTIQLLHS